MVASIQDYTCPVVLYLIDLHQDIQYESRE